MGGSCSSRMWEGEAAAVVSWVFWTEFWYWLNKELSMSWLRNIAVGPWQLCLLILTSLWLNILKAELGWTCWIRNQGIWASSQTCALMKGLHPQKSWRHHSITYSHDTPTTSQGFLEDHGKKYSKKETVWPIIIWGKWEVPYSTNTPLISGILIWTF